MNGWDVLWLVVLAAVVLAVGMVAGWNACNIRHEQRERAEKEAHELERARIQHDTKRVSVARPGTRPGRVRKATMNMEASNMQQHGREL